MINVFIDTSIFVAEGYVKGKSIATLFDAAQEEKERLIKETADRITQGEVLVLGTLAHLGHELQ